MSERLFQRTAELFGKCADLSPESLVEFLDEHCAGMDDLRAEIEALISHDRCLHDTDLYLVNPTIDLNLERIAAESVTPEWVGSFRVLREIGRGGMGVVYEAEQQEPRRRVAVKVIHGLDNPDTAAQLRREAHIHALIEHPGIARIYECGSAEISGRSAHYIAMELIDGEPIDNHIESMPYTIGQKLELLASCADALQAAHTRGVIHRDLKPANVLITTDADGKHSPVIVDFGIARLMNSVHPDRDTLVDAHGLMGTLGYMSPEQLAEDQAGDDARSDIYALGAIAYKALSGHEVCDLEGLSIAASIAKLLNHSPRAIGAHNRSLRGDLESVVHTAIARDPKNRYASSAAFSEDIRRVLASRPILASPPSAMRSAIMLLSRHKLATLVTVIVLTSLLSFMLYSRAQRSRALVEAGTHEEIAAFLENVIASSSPNELGKDTTVREAVEVGEEMLDGRFESRPLVEAKLRMVLGKTHRALGDEGASLKNYQRASELFDLVLGANHRTSLYAKGRVGVALRNTEDFESAIRIFNTTLDTQSHRFGKTDADTLTTMNSLAVAYARSGQLHEAERIHQEVLDAHRSRGEPDIPLYTSIHNLAQIQWRTGRHQKALANLNEAEAGYTQLGDRLAALVSLQLRGAVLSDMGMHSEAAMALRNGLDDSTSSLTPDHWLVRVFQVRLAIALVGIQEVSEAKLLLEAVLHFSEDSYFSMRQQAQELYDSL